MKPIHLYTLCASLGLSLPVTAQDIVTETPPPTASTAALIVSLAAARQVGGEWPEQRNGTAGSGGSYKAFPGGSVSPDGCSNWLCDGGKYDVDVGSGTDTGFGLDISPATGSY